MTIKVIGSRKFSARIFLTMGLVFLSLGIKSEGVSRRKNSPQTTAAVVIQELSGEVVKRKKGENFWTDAAQGMAVSREEEIKTEQGRVKIDFGPGKSLRILEGSHCKIHKDGLELLQGSLRISWEPEKKESIYLLAKKTRAEISRGILECWIAPETGSVVIGSVEGNIDVLVSLEGKVYRIALEQKNMVIIPVGQIPDEKIIYLPSSVFSAEIPVPQGMVASFPTAATFANGLEEEIEEPEPIEASSFRP
ncbi:MAG: hypothetical protein ABII74_09955 [Elusimicrobiota bacterium]